MTEKKTRLPENSWIAVPLYNHSSTLREILEKSLEYSSKILVIDDGSTDCDPADIIDGLPVELIQHGKNLGKGAAILSAAEFVKKNGGSSFITIDADGQHLPQDLEKFIPLLKENKKRIIIGVREFDSKTIPFRSRLGRKLSNWAVKLETGTAVRDSQSGFRSYPLELFDEKITAGRFGFETEILVRGLKKGLQLTEADISVHYPPAKERITHFHPFKDNFRIFLLHLKLLFS